MSAGDRRLDPDRRLSPAEVRAYLDAPIDQDERDAVQDLVRWFCRRYPTPAARLAYVRRAYARWRRTQGLETSRVTPGTD